MKFESTILVRAAAIAGMAMGGAAFAQATNDTCPISGRPINGTSVSEFDGKTIGFCCNRCKGKFDAADAEGKAEMMQAVFTPAVKDEAPPKADDKHPWIGIYTLGKCPVSGKSFDAKADPIVRVIEGREVRFCCNGCPSQYEAQADAYAKQIEEKIIKDQAPYYPLKVCVVVPDDVLEVDGDFVGVNLVHHNRLVRFCCKHCAGEFKESPDEFLAKIDAEIKKIQGPAYPLDECVVAGHSLGSMGEPFEMIVANRLVRLCCEGCVETFVAHPEVYLAKLDEAWKKQGGIPTAAPAGE